MNRVTNALSARLTHVVNSDRSGCLTETSLYSTGRYPAKPGAGYGVTAKI